MYKTFTQQVNSLRQDIIASIKEYLRKNVGAGSLDISENPVMCDTCEIYQLSIDGAKVFNLKGRTGRGQFVKFETFSVDDLRRVHSLLITGDEKI